MASAERILQLIGDEDAKSRAASLSQLPPFEDSALEGLIPTEPEGFRPPDTNPTLLRRAFQGLSLAFEPLRRTTQAFRETILFGTQRFTFDEYKQRFRLALNGSARLSTNDFLRLMMGKETFEKLRRTPGIPGWVAAIHDPDMPVLEKIKTGQISVGDYLTVGGEILFDPFTLLALTPVGAGAKLSLAVQKLPGGSKFIKGLTYPYRSTTGWLDRTIGPSGSGPLAMWNLVRQPESMLPKSIFQRLAIGKQAMLHGTHGLQAKLKDHAVKHGVKPNSDLDQRIGAWLWGKRGIKFTDEELKIRDGFNAIVREQLDEMVARKTLKLTPSQIRGLEKGGALAHWMPTFAFGKKAVLQDITQSWTLQNLGKIGLFPSKRAARARGVSIDDVPIDEFSGILSVRDFTYVAQRKAHLEPALLGLRVKHEASRLSGEALVRSRIAAGELEEVARLSRWQREYLKDLINVHTGNQTGRKGILLNQATAEFWMKIADSPMAQRIQRYLRKRGYGTTRDGFADVSITTKLSGLMMHGIILNTLGGRLRSALVNLTQTSNFAVKHGLPATFRGMLRFNQPELRQLRKEVNLLDEFHNVWRDEVWVSGFGEKWSRVLMAPFTMAERLIRGVGFNVGLDRRLRAKGFKSIAQAKRAGKWDAIKADVVHGAFFDAGEGAFFYGTLGRAPILANPLLRPFTTLLSYGPKQAEFLRRAFVEDGSAMMRFIGLHGFMIEKANEHAGIAAETFLGWGFRPMTRSFGGVPLLTNPPAQVLLDSAEGLNALADGDFKQAERSFKRVGETLPLVAPIPFPWLQTQELVGNPVTGKPGLIEMWETGMKRVGPRYEGQDPITQDEVRVNFLIGRSTTQEARSNLATRRRRALRKIDFELGKRVRKVFEATRDGEDDGNVLGQAMWEMVQPIDIEGVPFYPTEDQMVSRLRNLGRKKAFSRDQLAMMDNKFLSQIFYWASLEMLDRRAQ